MANLTETATYDAAVYQLETTDPVLGGPGGISNSQAQALANRTKYLKAHVDALETSAAGLAPINSPTFTGDPKAPTAPLGDKDTSIANTEFVQNTCYGILSKSVAGGVNVTLSATEAGNGMLLFTGAITANIAVIVPAVSKSWIVVNNTTGNYSLTLKTAAGTGVLLPQGRPVFAYCDAVNVELAGSANQSSFAVTTATATAGQTAFSVQYTPGNLIVVKNDAVLNPSDFVATDGSSANLTVGAIAGDKLVFFAFSSFEVANAVMKAGDTMSGALTLFGDATSALHAVPKQQVESLIAAIFAQNNVWGKGQRAAETVLADGATITPNFNDSNDFKVTLGGNRTLANPTNLVVGQSGCITVVHGGTYTLSYGSYYQAAGGIANLPAVGGSGGTKDELYYRVSSATSVTLSIGRKVE